MKYLLGLILIINFSCKDHPPKDANRQVEPETILTDEQRDLIYEKAAILPNQSQISIAIIKNGVVQFYGVKREQDSTLTIQNHQAIFEIGSITKVFTCTLLADFVVNQKIELDDNIDALLGFSLKDNVKLSFKQLATHTSGLPRVPASLDSVSLENPYKGYGEMRLKKYLSEKLEMVHTPGEKCDYSNLGVGLLGHVLTKVEGRTFEELLQAIIFSKYKMNNSTTIRAQIEDRLLKGLNDEGLEVSNWDLAVFMGAGGILSTVEDLSKFVLAQFDISNKELALSRRNFFTVSENFSMGLGWSIIKTETGQEWNWHNGGTGGYTSSMILDTKTKNGVIILSNISALGKLTNTIASLSPALMNTLN